MFLDRGELSVTAMGRGIAWRNRWIDDDQLRAAAGAMGKSTYAANLHTLLSECRGA